VAGHIGKNNGMHWNLWERRVQFYEDKTWNTHWKGLGFHLHKNCPLSLVTWAKHLSNMVNNFMELDSFRLSPPPPPTSLIYFLYKLIKFLLIRVEQIDVNFHPEFISPTSHKVAHFSTFQDVPTQKRLTKSPPPPAP
jgi:hypothetical protein